MASAFVVRRRQKKLRKRHSGCPASNERRRAQLTFVRYDPPAVKEERSWQAPAADGLARARRRLRILIADDERDQVATLAAILQDEGHQIREVYRGTEVLRMLHEFDPDVALVDIGMPGMTGYDVAREIRQAYGKERPVLVAITGWKKSSDKIAAKLAGFDHHLPKPFETKELLELIEPLVAGLSGAAGSATSR
jgi:CheY-like chemotaxis protein